MSASKSQKARDHILDLFETKPRWESDELDAAVAQHADIAAKTVKNIRTKLKADGLIRTFPEKDELGAIIRWVVERTNAPRPVGSHIPTDKTRLEDLAQPSQIPTHILGEIVKGPGSLHPYIPQRGTPEELEDVVETEKPALKLVPDFIDALLAQDRKAS